MRISDWSSDVCSSDLRHQRFLRPRSRNFRRARPLQAAAPVSHGAGKGLSVRRGRDSLEMRARADRRRHPRRGRSEEHTSELQSLMRISYAVFCLKKKKTSNNYLIIDKYT